MRIWAGRNVRTEYLQNIHEQFNKVLGYDTTWDYFKIMIVNYEGFKPAQHFTLGFITACELLGENCDGD